MGDSHPSRGGGSSGRGSRGARGGRVSTSVRSRTESARSEKDLASTSSQKSQYHQHVLVPTQPKPTVSKNGPPPRNGSPHPTSYNRFSVPSSPPKSYPETGTVSALISLLADNPDYITPTTGGSTQNTNQRKSSGSQPRKNAGSSRSNDNKIAQNLSTTYDKPKSSTRSRSRSISPYPKSSGDERTSTPSNSDCEDMGLSIVHNTSPVQPLDCSLQPGQRFMSDSQVDNLVDDADVQMGYTTVESRKTKKAKRQLSPNSTGCDEPEVSAKKPRGNNRRASQKAQKASQNASQTSQRVPSLMGASTSKNNSNKGPKKGSNNNNSQNQKQKVNKTYQIAQVHT